MKIGEARKHFPAEELEIGYYIVMADMATLRHHQKMAEAANMIEHHIGRTRE